MKTQLNQYIRGLIFALIGSGFFFTSCDETNTFDGIRAVDFKVTANTTLITESESITYFDSSANVGSRVWTFEGGDVTTSDKVEQVVTYSNPGKFATMLDITFTDGKQEDRLFFVNVAAAVAADFDADARTVVLGNSVQFTNLTTGLDGQPNQLAIQEGDKDLPIYSWTFEGGVPATSTGENPLVNYPNTGTFKVTLTANRYAPEHSNTITKTGYINVVDVNVISPVSSTVSKFGSQINLAYSESFSSVAAEELGNFKLTIDGTEVAISSLEIDPNDDKVMVLKPETSIVEENESIVLNYAGGSIFSTAGSLVAPLPDIFVPNSVTNLWTGNMDFEGGDAGAFPPDWGTWNPTAGVNNNEFYMTTDAEAHGGSKSVQISYDGSADQWILDNKTPAPVLDGGNYRVVFWAKASTEGVDFDLRVIEAGWAAANDPANFSLTTEWTEYSFDFVANDAGALNRKVWWQLPGATEAFQVFVDDLKLYYLD